MKRNPLLGIAFALMILAGCGDDDDTPTSPRSTPKATTPPVPRTSEPEITIRDYGSTERFRHARRTWKGCKKTIYNNWSAEDLYGISVSGPLKCSEAVAVATALSKQAHRRDAAGEDCFPGYCRDESGSPLPTSVAGYRCTATNHGDVSISLAIVCRRGTRYVFAGAADDE